MTGEQLKKGNDNRKAAAYLRDTVLPALTRISRVRDDNEMVIKIGRVNFDEDPILVYYLDRDSPEFRDIETVIDTAVNTRIDILDDDFNAI